MNKLANENDISRAKAFCVEHRLKKGDEVTLNSLSRLDREGVECFKNAIVWANGRAFRKGCLGVLPLSRTFFDRSDTMTLVAEALESQGLRVQVDYGITFSQADLESLGVPRNQTY
jgi:hypothetical protein